MRIRKFVFLCVLFGWQLCVTEDAGAQQSGQQPPPAAANAQVAAIPEYPDSKSGLEHLLKDIMSAQKENDGARAEALLQSMVLPDFAHWYPENYDPGIAKLGVAIYAANSGTLPAQLARFFLEAENTGFRRVEVARFEKNCDDNSSEHTFAMLDGRLKEFPLYEARLLKGSEFKWLFPLVFVNGGFRFVFAPKFEEIVKMESHPHAEGENYKRVAIGANVQAAHLLDRVPPQYPAIAREEHLSGTVKMHAIIGTDGSIRSLRVLSGKCSLARASVDAVRRWRYQPTLLNGEPVEVDTQIDVIFSLQY